MNASYSAPTTSYAAPTATVNTSYAAPTATMNTSYVTYVTPTTTAHLLLHAARCSQSCTVIYIIFTVSLLIVYYVL